MMFTGIVAACGIIETLDHRGGDVRIRIATDLHAQASAREGDSISVSGACLTMLKPDPAGFFADVSLETLALTSLGSREPGDRVNLELAMQASDRFGGHIVSGHVDGLATLTGRQPQARAEQYEFELPESLSKYVATKGSICIDGVSLTVNSVDSNHFSVFLIPHTLQLTTLGELMPGDRVNIEVDMIARYLERLLSEGNEPFHARGGTGVS
jgi:riboflavin synthase